MKTTTKTDTQIINGMARAICIADGVDPDCECGNEPALDRYIPQARAAYLYIVGE